MSKKMIRHIHKPFNFVKAAVLFTIVLFGVFTSTGNKQLKDVGDLSSLFDGVHRANADTPHSCTSSSSSGGSQSGGVCSNSVGGCSYCDGSCGGSNASGQTSTSCQSCTGPSTGGGGECAGGCGGSASSGTGCGLY